MNRITHRVIRRRRQEGAVMLIVMLILLTATAMASVSLQATQTELRAAGNQRVAMQTQYAAEAAMSTTLAWVDAASLSGDFYWKHMKRWQEQGAPTMAPFGEPEIDPGNTNLANRTQWMQQRGLPFENAPLTVAGGKVAPSGSNVQQPDPIGSFGPRTDFVPGFQTDTKASDLVDYVVDLYDCQPAAATASAGSLINDIGSGVPEQFQIYCVVTSRGRSYVPYPNGTLASDITNTMAKTWTLDNGNRTYRANRFSASHDARATLVTPPILK